MRSRNLASPYDTVDYFRTAVRYDDWDAIFKIVSPKTQDWVKREVGEFAFKTFASGLKYKRVDPKAPPEVADLTLAELVHRSEILDVSWDPSLKGFRVQLLYPPIPPGKTNFPLVNAPLPGQKTDRWTVGIFEWKQEIAP